VSRKAQAYRVNTYNVREQAQLPSAHHTQVTACFIMDQRNSKVCWGFFVVVSKHFYDDILEDSLNDITLKETEVFGPN